MRFSDLPNRLRASKDLIGQEGNIRAGDWLFLYDLLEDAALKIEALERDRPEPPVQLPGGVGHI